MFEVNLSNLCVMLTWYVNIFLSFTVHMDIGPTVLVLVRITFYTLYTECVILPHCLYLCLVQVPYFMFLFLWEICLPFHLWMLTCEICIPAVSSASSTCSPTWHVMPWPKHSTAVLLPPLFAVPTHSSASALPQGPFLLIGGIYDSDLNFILIFLLLFQLLACLKCWGHYHFF